MSLTVADVVQKYNITVEQLFRRAVNAYGTPYDLQYFNLQVEQYHRNCYVPDYVRKYIDEYGAKL